MLLTAVVAALSAASPAAAQGHYTADEPATAVANPATVFLQATWTGVVRDRATGRPISSGPVVVQRLCSAVVINPAGYAVTTSLCVRPGPAVLLANALSLEGRVRVARGDLAPDQVDAFLAAQAKRTVFTGAARTQPPAATVAGWLGGHQEAKGAAGALRVAVVHAQPTTAGDVAVVRLNRTGLAAVEIIPDDTVHEGQSVVLSGYNGDGQARQTFAIRNRTTTVAPPGGTNRLTVASGIGPQARGGPVVDATGRLLALQDNDVTAADAPVRDLVRLIHIRRALAAAKVTATIGPADRAYRAALTDYFAGHFTQAANRFDALLAGTPSYQPARAYRAKATERRDTDGDAVTNAADWRTYAVSAAAGLTVLTLLHLTGRWRRPSATAVHPTNDPADNRLGQPATHPANEPPDDRLGEPAGHPANEPPGEPAAHSANEPPDLAGADTAVLTTDPANDDTVVLELDEAASESISISAWFDRPAR